MEEKQNYLSNFIGMGLIFLLLYIWMQYSAPPKTATPEPTTPNAAEQSNPAAPTAAPAAAPSAAPVNDSIQKAAFATQLGAFAQAGTGVEEISVLENKLMRVTFSNKGGRIKEVIIKDYTKINGDSSGNDIKSPLRLLEDDKNYFSYEIPVNGAPGGMVQSADLYFSSSIEGNTIRFKAAAGEGKYFEQTYTLNPDDYRLEYSVSTAQLSGVLSQNQLTLNWHNYLDKLEKNQAYERTMSTVYYKPADESLDYCNCRSDDYDDLGAKPIKWFSHSNQFFNTSIIANNFTFRNFTGQTHVFSDYDADLKLLKTKAVVPMDNGVAQMTIYTGPNEFERLKSFGVALEDVIPFGASVFGFINRWAIHPIFDFLARFIGSQGIIILLLTLIVKLMVYPLTYRMVYSQAKMSALKPQLDALRKKFGDDQQAMSVETMKMYSEFKVNPLGGCMPVLLQMPIWFALYRFFPAAIEFRQEAFLWATDLSSYDVALKFPFMVPGFGNHLSAFTLIWVATTLWYTWYSMKQMENPAMGGDQMKIMKYMQYLMPVMFMFFFNSFASGLTLYLCFSNILNIAQTVVTKQYLIDKDKIKALLEANKNKPKKTSGFRAKWEEAMKEAQRQQNEKKKK
jgi:YidC/Oxa1 family membrane protein insertase